MKLDYRNGVSIGEIALYTPSLVIATLLAVRHGFGSSAGWLFLISFSLARIIGGSFQLATNTHPTITNYTVSAVLTNIGFAPLELTALAMLSRLVSNINQKVSTTISTKMIKLVELILTIGVILGIIGGVNAGNQFSATGKFVTGHESIAGTCLLLVTFAMTIIGTLMVSFDMQYADRGDHRVFWAVVVSLPLLAVRLVYTCLSTLTHDPRFSLVGGSTTLLLCLAFLEELAVVIIYEGVGLTLGKKPSARAAGTHGQGVELMQTNSVADTNHMKPIRPGRSHCQRIETEKPTPRKEHAAVRVLKHLPIVRIGIWAFEKTRGQGTR
jgi:hypothetical protein